MDADSQSDDYVMSMVIEHSQNGRIEVINLSQHDSALYRRLDTSDPSGDRQLQIPPGELFHSAIKKITASILGHRQNVYTPVTNRNAAGPLYSVTALLNDRTKIFWSIVHPPETQLEEVATASRCTNDLFRLINDHPRVRNTETTKSESGPRD